MVQTQPAHLNFTAVTQDATSLKNGLNFAGKINGGVRLGSASIRRDGPEDREQAQTEEMPNQLQTVSLHVWSFVPQGIPSGSTLALGVIILKRSLRQSRQFTGAHSLDPIETTLWNDMLRRRPTTRERLGFACWFVLDEVRAGSPTCRQRLSQ